MGIGDHKITCINNSSKIKSGFKVGMSNSLQGLFFYSGFNVQEWERAATLLMFMMINLFYIILYFHKASWNIFIQTIGRFVKQY